MWHSGDGMGWWMVVGSVWMVFFWIAVAWLFFHFFGSAGSATTAPSESPLEIAKRRYAAGEITREQFEDLRRDLQA